MISKASSSSSNPSAPNPSISSLSTKDINSYNSPSISPHSSPKIPSILQRPFTLDDKYFELPFINTDYTKGAYTCDADEKLAEDCYQEFEALLNPNKKEGPPDETAVIMYYVPLAMKQKSLRILCENYGPLRFCKLAVNEETSGSKGYAVVKYDNEISAKRAVKELDGCLLIEYIPNQEPLKVVLAGPRYLSV
eukprot:490474_1